MAAKKDKAKITVAQIIHDLRSRKSYVTVIWKDQEEKKLGLPIPFGTKIEDIEAATHKAIEAFQKELGQVSIKVPHAQRSKRRKARR